MDFLRLLIVGFIICGILDLLTLIVTKKDTSSLNHFVVRPTINVAIGGAIGMAFVITLLFLQNK